MTNYLLWTAHLHLRKERSPQLVRSAKSFETSKCTQVTAQKSYEILQSIQCSKEKSNLSKVHHFPFDAESFWSHKCKLASRVEECITNDDTRYATYLICRLLLYSIMFNMIGKRPNDVRSPVIIANTLRKLHWNISAQKSSETDKNSVLLTKQSVLSDSFYRKSQNSFFLPFSVWLFCSFSQKDVFSWIIFLTYWKCFRKNISWGHDILWVD